MIRDSLIEALGQSSDGRRVIGTAETEDEAFEQISHSSADVAIIDINLREGSGIGLLERLRALDAAPKMRIVYTNHCSPRIRDYCSKLGATHVLSKGGNFSELLEVLDHETA